MNVDRGMKKEWSVGELPQQFIPPQKSEKSIERRVSSAVLLKWRARSKNLNDLWVENIPERTKQQFFTVEHKENYFQAQGGDKF